MDIIFTLIQHLSIGIVHLLPIEIDVDICNASGIVPQGCTVVSLGMSNPAAKDAQVYRIQYIESSGNNACR